MRVDQRPVIAGPELQRGPAEAGSTEAADLSGVQNSLLAGPVQSPLRHDKSRGRGAAGDVPRPEVHFVIKRAFRGRTIARSVLLCPWSPEPCRGRERNRGKLYRESVVSGQNGVSGASGARSTVSSPKHRSLLLETSGSQRGSTRLSTRS